MSPPGHVDALAFGLFGPLSRLAGLAAATVALALTVSCVSRLDAEVRLALPGLQLPGDRRRRERQWERDVSASASGSSADGWIPCRGSCLGE